MLVVWLHVALATPVPSLSGTPRGLVELDVQDLLEGLNQSASLKMEDDEIACRAERIPQTTTVPKALAKAIDALPRARPRTVDERLQYQRDGFLVLRQAVPTAIMRAMAPFLWRHRKAFDAEGSKEYESHTYLYDAPLRHFLTSNVSLGGLAADLEGFPSKPKSIGEAPTWGYCAQPTELKGIPWHSDVQPAGAEAQWHNRGAGPDAWDGYPSFRNAQQTAWVAINDAGRGLELIRGSHHARNEIYEACGLTQDGSHSNFLDETCVDRFIRRPPKFDAQWTAGFPVPLRLTKYRPNVQAGDIIIFDGHTLHRGFQQTTARLAVTVRIQNGEYASLTSAPIHPLTSKTRADMQSKAYINPLLGITECSQLLRDEWCKHSASGAVVPKDSMCECGGCNQANPLVASDTVIVCP